MFSTFNVADLSLFDTRDDSRLNNFEEGGNDEYHERSTSKDHLHVLYGPITRSKGHGSYAGTCPSYLS